MRSKRFTEEQIIGILKEADAGVPAKDICRQHGICEQTFYRWRRKFGGLDVSINIPDPFGHFVLISRYNKEGWYIYNCDLAS
jgi:hypothetical protein